MVSALITYISIAWFIASCVLESAFVKSTLLSRRITNRRALRCCAWNTFLCYAVVGGTVVTAVTPSIFPVAIPAEPLERTICFLVIGCVAISCLGIVASLARLIAFYKGAGALSTQ
ncbi:hypothetical protein BH09SUM1_BH09SUM1_13400 [soil metagenome]